jgi:PilZ domain
MEEQRKHPRSEIDEAAYVSSGGSVMRCMVRNISAEGAAIDIDNPAFVPAHFRLVMANGSSVRECRIAWIQQNRIGVTFAAMPQTPHRPHCERCPAADVAEPS